MNQVTVRVYGPLNDFLPAAQRQVAVTVRFAGLRSVKDVLEGVGVPHPEIDLVLVNGESLPFDHRVEDADRIAAFPRFHAVDISAVTRVRPDPPATARFVVDGHLAKLARRLRLVGLDASCPAGARDNELAHLAETGHFSEGDLATRISALSAAKLLIEALKQAGREVTREKIVALCEQSFELNLGQMRPLSFGPDRRVRTRGSRKSRGPHFLAGTAGLCPYLRLAGIYGLKRALRAICPR